MATWEYYTAKLSDKSALGEELNILGKLGWELVFMADASFSWLCVFKRPIHQ